MPRLYVFDLDGVLFRGETVIPEAPPALARLRAQGKRLRFLTNNSTQARRVYAEKLSHLGMPCAAEEIVTSASATAAYLVQRGAAGRTVFVVGGPGLCEELERAGMRVRTVADPPQGDRAIEIVAVGLDKAFRYETLLRAQQALLRGAEFLATNRDSQYPVEGGVIPGGGSIVAAIAAAAEREPLTIGKPERHSLEGILKETGVPASEAVLVGDRLDTDILCGNRVGVGTTLVLTGVNTREQALAAPPDQRPDRILETLDAL